MRAYTREEVINRANIRRDAINRILNTAEGEMLFEELKIMFGTKSVAKVDGRVDEAGTFVNVGAQEVIHHLRAIKDRKVTDVA